MPCQLHDDCVYDIEFLEKAKNTLHSCLFINHLWCEISARILWRDVLGNTQVSLILLLLAFLIKKSFVQNGIFVFKLQNPHFLAIHHFTKLFYLIKLI